MPRLPQNLHLVATWRSPAMRFANNTQHDTSKVLRLPRKITIDTSKVLRLPRKLQHIFWKRRKSIAPATQNDFRHVPEHVWMSRSATPATRNEATTRPKPPKMTTSAELLNRHGHTVLARTVADGCERLRTVADGCERLRPWTQRRANTPSTPRPPRVKREPLLRIREKTITDWWWKTGSMGRWKPGILKMNENYIDQYVLALWLNMNTDDVYNTLIICAEIEHITKAGLLAGAGFALAMNWGQTGCSFHDLSPRTVFGTPLLDMINHVELWTPPLRASNPVASVPLGVICDHVGCERTDIYKMLFTVSGVNGMQRNVMQSNLTKCNLM